MAQVSKSELIESLISKEEKIIEIAITKFQNMDETSLIKPASDGGWNIAQCLDHLNSYSAYYLPLIAQQLSKHQNLSSGEFFESGRLGRYFTKIMDPRTGKKYKAHKRHLPAIIDNPNNVVAKFVDHQESLIILLRMAEHSDMNKIRIPVSIAELIKLKLGDILQFIIVHNERHIAQAQNNIPKD